MIDPATLTYAQRAGRVCVLCGYPLYLPTAVRVGLVKGHYVYRCPHHRADEMTHLVLERTPRPARRPVSVPAGARHQAAS